MVHAVTVLVVTSDRFAAHDTGRWHPERAARLTATAAALRDPEFEGALRVIEPRPATDAELMLVHSAEHVGRIRVLANSGGGSIDADTPLVAASLPAALAAAGSGLSATRRCRPSLPGRPPRAGHRLLRGPAPRPSRHRHDGDGLLSVQQRGRECSGVGSAASGC